MKKLCVIFLLLSAAARLCAQMQPMSAPAGDTDRFSVISAQLLNDMIASAIDSDGIARAIKHHGRWDNYWRVRVANNAAPTESIFGKVIEGLDDFIQNSSNECLGTGYAGNWHCLGPFINYFGHSTDHAGRVVSLWVKPTDRIISWPDQGQAGFGKL